MKLVCRGGARRYKGMGWRYPQTGLSFQGCNVGNMQAKEDRENGITVASKNVRVASTDDETAT